MTYRTYRTHATYTPARLLLLLWLILDSSAREPIPAPPKVETQTKTIRARDLGILFEGIPGKFNAITDVPGVEVGYTTLIRGEGKLEVGKGPVRTGVTAILPRGREAMNDQVFAGYFSLNGNGEMTGTAWVEESGFLEGPIVLTNTHSVGVARDAVIAWRLAHGGPDAEGFAWSLPVVTEIRDGWLTDVDGFHVRPEHIADAIENAHSGAIEEGSVGGGTGMICYEFKGGIGTASRVVSVAGIGESNSAAAPNPFTIGVLVQANCGRRPQLTIRGLAVGKKIPGSVYKRELGSIIIVVATDAPLMPHQLKRLARRASLGLARTGSISSNGSGDIFIAFSTANAGAAGASNTASVSLLSNEKIGSVFEATVDASEEAIINALVAAETMVGVDGHRAEAIPHDRLREILRKYNRL